MPEIIPANELAEQVRDKKPGPKLTPRGQRENREAVEIAKRELKAKPLKRRLSQPSPATRIEGALVGVAEGPGTKDWRVDLVRINGEVHLLQSMPLVEAQDFDFIYGASTVEHVPTTTVLHGRVDEGYPRLYPGTDPAPSRAPASVKALAIMSGGTAETAENWMNVAYRDALMSEAARRSKLHDHEDPGAQLGSEVEDRIYREVRRQMDVAATFGVKLRTGDPAALAIWKKAQAEAAPEPAPEAIVKAEAVTPAPSPGVEVVADAISSLADSAVLLARVVHDAAAAQQGPARIEYDKQGRVIGIYRGPE